MLLRRILPTPIRYLTPAKIYLSAPIAAAKERPIFLYFPFYPILDFTNYTRSPLFIRIRLIGFSALSKISISI